MLRQLIFFPIVVLSTCLALAHASGGGCENPFQSDEPVLLARTYPFQQSKQEVEASFRAMLAKAERLEYRGMLSPKGEYLLPLVPLNVRGAKEPNDWVVLPETVSKAVVAHMKSAFQLGYALHPFFSDMGHGHLYLPPKKAEKLAKLKIGKVERWNLILNDPELLILYHATEKYNFSDLSDPQLVFLRQHRNIVGSVKNLDSIKSLEGPGGEMNTAGSIPGFIASGTLNFSASKRGCIPFDFRGDTLYLDFSFQGLSSEMDRAPIGSPQR